MSCKYSQWPDNEDSAAVQSSILRFSILSLNNNKKDKKGCKSILLWSICYVVKMMCHLVVVSITTVWGLKEPLAYLHVQAVAVLLIVVHFCC